MRISDWSSDVCSSDLGVDELAAYERMGRKSAENLVVALDRAREPAMASLLYALGIRHVGETTARDLARQFGSLQAVGQAGEEQLLGVPDVGPAVAGSVLRFFAEPHNQAVLASLDAAGGRASAPDSNEGSATAALAGQPLVLTETLPT